MANTDTTAKYEIRISNVPDGAYTEHYLTDMHSRYCETREEAEHLVSGFYAAMEARPQDFEPDMEAEIVEL